MNLVKVIEQIQSDISDFKGRRNREIEQIHKKYNKKIEELEVALKVNMDMNTTCLECRGRGSVAFASASGNTEREECRVCKGTGVNTHSK